MPRLRWLAAAQADLLDILESVARESGSVPVAVRLVEELRERCHRLATLPGVMGRARPELRADVRSVAYKSYVIFFRYEADRLEIVNIVHGHRDIGTFFDGDSSS